MRQQRQSWIAIWMMAMTGLASTASAQGAKKQPPPPPNQSTLERVRSSGVLRLGYRTDVRPFSFKDESGKPAGFTVDLCTAVAERLKTEQAGLKVEWVPVEAESRFAMLKGGQVDLLCGADTETLARRADVSFSIPIFPGGIGALLRTDAARSLKDVLSGATPVTVPNWRASAVEVLHTKHFIAVKGTTAATWLTEKVAQFKLTSAVSAANDYADGVQLIVNRKADVFFGDRAILLDLVRQNPPGAKLMVLDRQFTTERLALAFGRGDDDFRLLVDRTLSGLFAAGGIDAAYTKWFSMPSQSVRNFYQWITLPN